MVDRTNLNHSIQTNEYNHKVNRNIEQSAVNKMNEGMLEPQKRTPTELNFDRSTFTLHKLFFFFFDESHYTSLKEKYLKDCTFANR
jgi:hypothetical protein